MDRESFLDTLRQKYAENIHEAYLECEHEDGRSVDYPRLNGLLQKLAKTAKVEGLPPKEFEDLVRSTLPEVNGKLDLGKKAA
jgi:hypothetical protein